MDAGVRLLDILATLVALLCIGLGLLLMERPRTGLEISHLSVGQTPATVMRAPGASGPAVVIAHGFAGSRQLMHPFQLTLARAGYIAVSYDLQGHGRNPVPMSGDVTSPDGTTRLLTDELGRVVDAVLELPGVDGRVAVLGHSMASDIIVRQAVADGRVGAAVAISLFSEAVTAEDPANLLIVNGAWERRLRIEARRIMGELGGTEGVTVGDPGGDFARRAVAAPMVEHVGVLYSPTALREALDWINRSFGRNAENGIAAIGGPILLSLLGVVLLASPLARLLPKGPRPNEVPPGAFWTLVVAPAILAPSILSVVETRFLPVLVADYLALHLGVWGLLGLVGLAVTGDVVRLRGWLPAIALAVFSIAVFGGILDRYVASFMPHPGRWPILGALLPGAVLAMVADAAILQAGHAPAWRRAVARAGLLVSLGIAVVLDPERLFFLLMILPVILLFFLTFGVMGGFVGRRTGSAFAMGLGLGIVLAWALAVSFPMFIGTGV